MDEWLRFTRRAKGHVQVRTVVRYLSTDPYFVRAVAPDSDAVKVDELFVWPLVLQSLAVLRAGLHWPPPIVTAALIESMTGVPSFAAALASVGLAPAEGGMYDLIPLGAALAVLTGAGP